MAWERDEQDEELPSLRTRRTFGWILRGDVKAGALELREYDMCACDANETLWMAADAAGYDASQAIYALCSQWRDLGMSVAAYGSVLELGGLWLLPSQGKACGAQILNAFVRTACRGYSLVILKAFPLEYESKLGDEPALKVGFEHRKRAMQRYYARSLGMKPFPGPTGDAGWMWKPAKRVAKFIAPPTYSDDPFPEDE
ncbi:MAG: hypothetical protein AB7T59_07680 [Hyphomonadaceae bacterium]